MKASATTPGKGGTNMADKYRRLRNRMKAKGFKSYQMAEAMDVSVQTLSRKLNGVAPFTEDEIEHICILLDIRTTNIGQFFFEHLTAYENEKIWGGTN